MLGTEPVLPFAMAELELLGLLGPEPGALLQRDDTGRDQRRAGEGNERNGKVRVFPRVFPGVFVDVRDVFSPDISIALFLKVLMTVPSFLRRRGELRLSATFCFKRERTLRFGSETGGGSGEEDQQVWAQTEEKKIQGERQKKKQVRLLSEQNNLSSTARTDEHPLLHNLNSTARQ